MQTDNVRAELVELEQQGWRSLCDGTASDFYAATMTDDAVMIMANGAVMDRGAVVDALRGASMWSSFDLEDVRVIPAGDDAAALVYRGTARRDANTPPFVGEMTSVYTRVDGAWKLALYQQTPLDQSGR